MTEPYDWAADPDYAVRPPDTARLQDRHRRMIGALLLAAAVMFAWFVTRSAGPVAGVGPAPVGIEQAPVGIHQLTINVAAAAPAGVAPEPVDIDRSAELVRAGR